jgi:hypothetical protein
MDFFSFSDWETDGSKLAGWIIILALVYPVLSDLRKKVRRVSRGFLWNLGRVFWPFEKKSLGFFHFRKKEWGSWTRAHFAARDLYVPGRRMSLAELALQSDTEPNDTFRPWIKEYLMASLWAMLAMAWTALVVFLYTQQRGYYILAMAFLAVVLLYLSTLRLENGNRRKHGQAVEKNARNKFLKILPADWRVLPRNFVPYVGDFDMPLRFGNGELCAVEIKSWHRWPMGVRAWKAISQVHKQRWIIQGSYSVIWLPEQREVAYTGFHNGVFVVGGNAGFLLKKLNGIIHCDAVIKFPRPPSNYTLSQIKAAEFKYDPVAYQWTGKCCKEIVDELRPQITRERGKITVICN